MARYQGGAAVQGGYYWNSRSWEVEVIPEQGGILKATDGSTYTKVPFLALFVIVPLLGALFLMFLPMIGFVLFAQALGKKLAASFGRGATELASTVQPGQFAAGSAYFTGKPEEAKEGDAPAAQGGELASLEKEIAERKQSR